MGAVPKTGQKTLFATPECHWSTCGVGPRAEDLSEDSLFPALRSVIFPASFPVLLPPRPPFLPPTLFFGEEDDGWTRNFINFLILEKEGQTRFLQ